MAKVETEWKQWWICSLETNTMLDQLDEILIAQNKPTPLRRRISMKSSNHAHRKGLLRHDGV